MTAIIHERDDFPCGAVSQAAKMTLPATLTGRRDDSVRQNLVLPYCKTDPDVFIDGLTSPVIIRLLPDSEKPSMPYAKGT